MDFYSDPGGPILTKLLGDPIEPARRSCRTGSGDAACGEGPLLLVIQRLEA